MKSTASVSCVILAALGMGLTCNVSAKPTSGGSSSSSSSSSGGSSTTGASPAAPGSSSTAAIQSQMLAYGALDHIAGGIARSVCNKAEQYSTIIIYDQASFASLQSYAAFRANARLVEDAYDTLVPESDEESLKSDVRKSWLDYKKHLEDLRAKNKTASNSSRPSTKNINTGTRPDAQQPIATATAPPPQDLPTGSTATKQGTAEMVNSPPAEINFQIDPRLLDGAIKNANLEATFALSPGIQEAQAIVPLLSSLAVSSNSESPGSVSIPDSALALQVTRELENCNKGYAIAYPPLFGGGSASDIAGSHIATFVRILNIYRKYAHAAVIKTNEVYFQSHKKDLAKGASASEAISTSALTDINGLYDSFMNLLLQQNSSTGAPGSATIVQGYQLATLLGESGKRSDSEDVRPTYVLLASIVAAGGTEHDKKSFWTNLTTGDDITYNGGAIVNFALWDSSSSTPLENHVLRYETPFFKIKNPCNWTGVSSGSNLDAGIYYRDSADLETCAESKQLNPEPQEQQ